MLGLIGRWIAGALALLAVAYLLPWVTVESIEAAAIAAVVLGLLNALIGPVLRFVTKPLACLTFGLFALVINAFLFWAASELTTGFYVEGALGAFVGAIVYGLAAGLIAGLLGARR